MYNNLLSPENLILNGAAQITTGFDETLDVLRLTDDFFQAGNAFSITPFSLFSGTSFNTFFQFQITDSGSFGDEDGPGADGLAFVIQSDPNALGGLGGALGYGDISQSLAVELDTYNNQVDGFPDINGNHLGINLNGDSVNSVIAEPIEERLNNGEVWSAWVDYNGLTDQLEVRVDQTNVRPESPTLSYIIDLPSILGVSDVFFGFSSGTGGATGDHDILAWNLSVTNTFVGTSGSDKLTGTTSADTLIGLAGNDTYTVNNNGDVVTENLNEGTDTVKSDITYTLPDNVENLILKGGSNLNGTGNGLKNKLTGNAGNNTLTGLDGNDALDGKAGADTLIGGLGNDTYTVDNVGDVVIENPNEGADTVKASIDYILGANLENLTLSGTANLNGTGNSLKNRLTGNSGANILNGGAGADTLGGKDGNDIFVFQFGQSILGSVDRITDFAIGADKIDLLTQGGSPTGTPTALTRAADSATTNLNIIVNNVFADADGAQAGNQALGLNSAALVRANTATYLIINDGAAGFQSTNDLVVNLTGITGTLPTFGAIPVGNFFF
ncbi:MAG: lectin-like domain-containing protein [Cyanobacteriota bacterium]